MSTRSRSRQTHRCDTDARSLPGSMPHSCPCVHRIALYSLARLVRRRGAAPRQSPVKQAKLTTSLIYLDVIARRTVTSRMSLPSYLAREWRRLQRQRQLLQQLRRTRVNNIHTHTHTYIYIYIYIFIYWAVGIRSRTIYCLCGALNDPDVEAIRRRNQNVGR